MKIVLSIALKPETKAERAFELAAMVEEIIAPIREAVEEMGAIWHSVEEVSDETASDNP